jgi:hypothetical protein
MTFFKWILKNICEKIMKNLQLHFSQKKKKKRKKNIPSEKLIVKPVSSPEHKFL